MKTKASGPLPGKFNYKNGVERHTQTRPIFKGLLSLAVMAGLVSALAVNMPQASNYFNKSVNRQAQATAIPVPKAKTGNPSQVSASKLPQQDKQLTKKIAAKLATFPKSQQWSVYVEDIETNRTASINADTSYEPASFYKLFLLAPLESKYPSDKWSTRVQGKSLKICIDLMLRLSDNVCGQAIGNMINWGYADTFNESLGFSKTKFGEGKGGKTTPKEVGELFVNLRKGEILTDKARRQVFDSLYGQKHAKGIPAGCTNCRVANKTGDINGFVHDGGVITHGQDSYVLVIMSKGGSFDQIAELTRIVEADMYP